jgi:surface carbohydrate biosynthesis protein (TIGR04326 family)
MENTVHIWDSEEIGSPKIYQNILWRSYTDSLNEKSVSIPRLVEKNSSHLKKLFLAWVFELGEVRVEGKRVVDHLEISPSFSFWWMSLIPQKLNYSASPHITTAIRLLAFDLWARDREINLIRLTSQNKALAECMQRWCLDRKVDFVWEFLPSNNSSTGILHNIYKRLPNLCKALIQFIRRIWCCWPLRKTGLDAWSKSDGKVSFFSYLSNLDETGEWKGEFRSRFWTKLPETLIKNDCKSNWLHIYCADSSHPTAQHARAKLEKFNKMAEGEQIHTALETFLSWQVIFQTLKDWFRILHFARKLEPFVSKVDCNSIHLWPLFKEEWYSSILGASSINTIFDFNLLKKAVEFLPKQKIGAYLYEQQSWELALIHCWKKEQHGVLVGAQHTSLLDWNLRNFHDPRSYKRSNNNDLPMPDILAVNGPAAMKVAKKNGYPKTRLLEVEALRYIYLEDLSKNKKLNRHRKTNELRVLVLSDYLAVNTENQMDLLLGALPFVSRDIEVTLKPHPALNINAADYMEIEINLVTDPVQDLLGSCDVAYTSPVTSAAVDAYCFGVPVITALDSDALNLSPLRNCDDVCFVSTSEQLSEALNSIASRDVEFYEKKEFFRLDSELPRWKELLLESNTPI